MRGAFPVSFRFYVIVVLCAALPTALLGLFWPVIGITNCHGEGYSSDRFLAYCESTDYGDYEHGALYYDLEPEAIGALRAADILIFGNSRTQVAFSTRAVDAFAAAHNWSIYRLGFGFVEESAFPERLIRRYHLRPRVIIVNVDPFFTGNGSNVSNALLSGTDWLGTYLHLLIERLAQRVQRATCAAHLSRLTCGNARTIYRSRIDGTWDITYFRKPERFPVVIDPDREMDIAPRAIAVAREFLATASLSPSCMILTTVPDNFATPLLVQTIAHALGSPLVEAKADGLSTFDLGHLDAPSAQRWSAQFLNQAEPLISACLAATTVRSSP
jgi:hypothetical protein